MNLRLIIQVYIVRFLQGLAALIDRNFIRPIPISSSFRVRIPTTLTKGSIHLYFYFPKSYSKALIKKDLPLIVNFHGSGFTIGNARDDARWVDALLAQMDAVFVSVGYRKGPEYCQPTAVQDGVEALVWLWKHSDQYGIDASKTILTGFSAGGNMCFTVPLMQEQYKLVEGGKLAGIVAFYPSVNQAITRKKKFASNPLSKDSEPPWLHRMIDAAYYQNLPPEGRASVYLSPALAKREQLLKLPQKVAIYTCEQDKLLVEAEDFRTTLQSFGKEVGGSMVFGVGHGFDKKHKQIEKREKLYGDAIEQIKSMLA